MALGHGQFLRNLEETQMAEFQQVVSEIPKVEHLMVEHLMDEHLMDELQKDGHQKDEQVGRWEYLLWALALQCPRAFGSQRERPRKQEVYLSDEVHLEALHWGSR